MNMIGRFFTKEDFPICRIIGHVYGSVFCYAIYTSMQPMHDFEFEIIDLSKAEGFTFFFSLGSLKEVYEFENTCLNFRDSFFTDEYLANCA